MKFVVTAFLFLLGSISAQGAGSAYQAYSKGIEFESKKEYEKAVDQFKKATGLKSNYIAAYIECARSYVMLGKREDGLAELSTAFSNSKEKEDWERITKERSTLSELFYTNETFQSYQNGLNYLRLDRSNSALEAFEKAYAVEPTNMLVLLGYARALEAEDNQKLRLEILERAYQINEGKREARIALADALISEDEARAYELLRFVASDRSASEEAVILYSRALWALKRKKEAMEFLGERSEKHPAWIMSQFWLGKFYASELGGAWLARKHLMTFLKRVEPLMQGENARNWKTVKTEADVVLIQVNKSLE